MTKHIIELMDESAVERFIMRMQKLEKNFDPFLNKYVFDWSTITLQYDDETGEVIVLPRPGKENDTSNL